MVFGLATSLEASRVTSFLELRSNILGNIYMRQISSFKFLDLLIILQQVSLAPPEEVVVTAGHDCRVRAVPTTLGRSGGYTGLELELELELEAHAMSNHLRLVKCA